MNNGTLSWLFGVLSKLYNVKINLNIDRKIKTLYTICSVNCINNG